MSRKSIGWKIYGSFFLVLGTLLYLSFSSFQNANRLIFDVSAVDQTYSFTQQIHSLTSSLRDTEMANNAYLLLGKDRYLNSYHENSQMVIEQLTNIQNEKNINFKKYGRSLKDLIAQKIEDMDQAASQREKNGLNYALQVFLTGRWQQLSEGIQKDLDAVENRQKLVLDDQLGRKTQSIRKTVLSIALGVTVSLILFFLASLIIRRDFLKRLIYEDELEIARYEAIQASEFKSQFLANMSHEIRTPMNGILGMATALLDTPLGEQQNKYTGIIKRSCEALLRIINDILDLSKIEAGKLDICLESFDLNILLGEIEALFSNTIKLKDFSLQFQVDGNVPNLVVGDSGRIRQILNNLIGNAIKFTEKGSVTVTSSMTTTTEGNGRNHFEIRDTGIGISVEGQKKIFGAFQQAEVTTGKRFGGTGLGLNISKQLVEIMGGKIGFSSDIGKGSTFWFDLDLPISPKELSTHKENLEVCSKIIVTQKANLLIADDTEINHDLLRVFLNAENYILEFAFDGKEALDLFKKKKYDLILIDVQMPVMGGLEAVRLMRIWEKEQERIFTSILACTGGTTERELKDCKESGCDGFISKPIERDKFLAVIGRHLRSKSPDDLKGVGNIS